MDLFIPDVAYIDSKALNYDEGKKALEFFKENNVEIIESRRVKIDENSNFKKYTKSKRTVLLTVNRQKKLVSCNPSADYQFHLSKSCPGHCEYCYLQTSHGEKPYMKIFTNIDEIIDTIKNHTQDDKVTHFEAASLTDPVALDHITGGLKKVIEFFSNTENAKLRLVTKFSNIDSYLDIKHNNNTKFRFSINTDWVIENFEHNTSSIDERIDAARKIANAKYPIGFIIAPIIIYDNWKEDYKNMIKNLSIALKNYDKNITFELIQHRFTKKAKNLILERFPNTKLDLNEENRHLKWGPYGNFKYVYKKEESKFMKEYITDLVNKYFENSDIQYFT